MNLKELHNPTFRQEDNRLYLVGNTMEKPNINEFKSIPFCESGDCRAYRDELKDWEKSEVKYPVRESDVHEIKCIFYPGIIDGNKWQVEEIDIVLSKEGIPVPPELMERLVLKVDCEIIGCRASNKCINSDNCCNKGYFITLKEEPKGESEDDKVFAEIKLFVKQYLKDHEFQESDIRSQGYWYTSKNGSQSINLSVMFEEILEDFYFSDKFTITRKQP